MVPVSYTHLLLDVYNGDVTIEEFVAKMSLEEMATLNCGSGWGVANENAPVVGSSSDTVPGAAGETTVKYFDTHGIPSIVVADGPGGIRVKQEYEATDVNTGEVETYYQYCTAWPVSVLSLIHILLAENVMSHENATSEEVTNAETVLTKAVEGLVVNNTPVTPSLSLIHI